MSNLLFCILLFLFQVKYFNCLNIVYEPLNENSNQTIELKVGFSNNYALDYNEAKYFIFNITNSDTYQANIHSINCNIKVDFNGEIMNQINLDTYSLKINKSNKNIKIKPLIDVISGEEIENYEQKICYVTINSINENAPVVTIQNKEGSFFYFKDYNVLNISYQLIRIYPTDFGALFFQFNENYNFSINITCRNKNLIHKNIYNSSYIYLYNDIFAKDEFPFIIETNKINVKHN